MKIKCYFLSSSKTRFGRILAKTPKEIQKGTINPNKKNNNQNAIPLIKRNAANPYPFIIFVFNDNYYVVKLRKYFNWQVFLEKNYSQILKNTSKISIL